MLVWNTHAKKLRLGVTKGILHVEEVCSKKFPLPEKYTNGSQFTEAFKRAGGAKNLQVKPKCLWYVDCGKSLLKENKSV